jgi:hypothetical protein
MRKIFMYGIIEIGLTQFSLELIKSWPSLRKKLRPILLILVLIILDPNTYQKNI